MTSPSSTPLVKFFNSSILRSNGEKLKKVLNNLNFEISPLTPLAIVGKIGTGKSSLGDAILGLYLFSPNDSIQWNSTLNTTSLGVRVSFKEEGVSYGNSFHQARYHSWGEEMTTLDYILGKMTTDNRWRNHEWNVSFTKQELEKVAIQLDVVHLLPLAFSKLSNGQTRRVRLTKAILSNKSSPFLILDEPTMGLDVHHRSDLIKVMSTVSLEKNIVWIARPMDKLPDFIENVVELDKLNGENHQSWFGSRREYEERHKPFTFPPKQPEKQPEKQTEKQPEKQPEKQLPPNSKPMVELKNVSIKYGDKTILSNISWTIFPGEKWLLRGHNGSGKTTLLSIIVGDNPQSFGQFVQVFGGLRGDGQTIWELKRNIGLTSPEIHNFYKEPLNARQVISTGFHEPQLLKPLTAQQEKELDKVIEFFGIKDIQNVAFSRLSTGQQRLILLLRSITIRNAKLIILDEGFSGLDEEMMKKCMIWLDMMKNDQALIFVTHEEMEIPTGMTHVLELSNGKIIKNEPIS